ncbi:amidase [Fictibacillus sp. WQ 8-8]|uniref:amidase n=1 Tax=Fictibacillus sp. WQ 8-8 TaxID=2938788 RepID=UPI00210F1DD0|nr:amidase [Fictibacillus sp. WQ 8-8]MCQ6268353.1 amidase [Fictibacillus sp. WQ 8-8]
MAIKVKKDLLFKTINEIAAMYRKKEISPIEVTEATLERLDELEPQLNAFVTVLADEALIQAKKAEEAFVKGRDVGKLYGVPVSIKDIFNTKGIRTSLGSRIMQDNVPSDDAFVYTALKEAGAVVFGKTNMLEFAYGSVHSDYGQCNNPWNVNRTAGGSSTGSGSSVAAGIGFGSIGTDTGGSIRVPASFCGIVGLKPTYGTVPRQGLFPLSRSLDHIGPLTRTVIDNGILLESISSIQLDYDSVFSGEISGVKVGVIHALTESITHPEVKDLTSAALYRLQQLGAESIDVTIPSIEKAEEIAIPILLSEASSYHQQWYPHREGDYAPSTFANIKEGFNISAVSYLSALDQKRKFTEAVNDCFNQVDVLVCPTVPYPATEKDPSFEDGNIDISVRTIPFNISGHPSITVSAGNATAENLPVGFQIVGRYHDEATVYRVAHALQLASGGYIQPPL